MYTHPPKLPRLLTSIVFTPSKLSTSKFATIVSVTISPFVNEDPSTVCSIPLVAVALVAMVIVASY